LGYLYETGQGIEKNLREAVKWYAQAAKSGNKAALGRLKALRKR